MSHWKMSTSYIGKVTISDFSLLLTKLEDAIKILHEKPTLCNFSDPHHQRSIGFGVIIFLPNNFLVLSVPLPFYLSLML